MKANSFLTSLLLVAASQAPALAQFDMGEPDPPAWTLFKLNPKVKVQLDFRNASADAIIQTLTRASGVTIIKDPSLNSTITLQSPFPQNLTDSFAMFSSALSLRNFEIKKDGNVLIIRQKSNRSAFAGFGGGAGGAGGTGPGAFGGPPGGGATQNVLKVYTIKYANATQVARVVNEVFATLADNNTTPNFNPFGGGGGGFGGGGGRFAGGGGFGGGGGGGRGGGFGGGGGGFGGGQGGGGFNPFAGGGGGFGGRRGGNTNTATVKASSDDFSNSVIINATKAEHDQIGKIIEQIDRQTDQPQRSQVFTLKYANATDMAPVIQNVLVSNAPRGRGGAGVQNVPIDQRFQQAARLGGTQASFGTVAAETRTNTLVVTATTENMEIVTKVIEQLDKPVKFENGAFVVTLKNARADAIAQVLNQSFATRNGGASSLLNNNQNNNRNTTGSNRQNGNNGGGGGGGNQPPSLTGRAAPLHTTTSPTRAAALGDPNADPNPDPEPDPQFPGGGGGFGGGFGGGGQFGGGGFGQQRNQTQNRTTGMDASGRVINVRDITGGISAIADVSTNSVIIVTSPENRELINQILAQLDKIPEQVMIETLIVEASLDATSKLGVEWNLNSGTSSATSAFGLKADATQPQGLRYTLTGTQYGAFLQSLKTDSRFEVLSTPRIFTSNNATASINISQSLPYVLSSRTDATGNLSYNYAFLDVGIILTVTPRITSNGYVTMDVTQTANDFVRYTNFNAPIVNQREAQTTVSVKDGETVVLGGIIKNSSTVTHNKIPLLGDLPLLGNFFRSQSKSNSKTELLVFLTPRIVRDAAEAKKLKEATEKQLQSTSLEKFLQVQKAQDAASATPQPKPVEKPKTEPEQKEKTPSLLPDTQP